VRRRVAGALGALAVVIAMVAPTAPAAASDGPAADSLTTTTKIKHFVVLMQANHSFDNYFGTYPGAEGTPAKTCVPVDPRTPGKCVKPFHLEGQALAAMGQSPPVHAAQYDAGAMDGFISAFQRWQGVGDQPMGYYDDRDIPFYWNVADNYVLFDRLFTSAAGSSVWNHMFWTTGAPGNPAADELVPTGFDGVPTIFDRLQAAGVSWKFYVQNYKPEITMRTPGEGHASAQLVRVPLLNYSRYLDDPALHSRIVDMSEYYKDLANGTLPAVSFMSPAGASEHAPSSVQTGERFVSSLVDGLMTSSSWKSSAFMWTYDDSGGWYDHVRPPAVDQYGYGFRSPGLLVSPYAKRGHVDHTTLDFTSELKFIENNWGVAPLAARDAAAKDITSAFDFSAPPRAATLLGTSRGTTPTPTNATTVVYLCYGLAVMVLAMSAVIWTWRRRRPVRRELA
jgi:phospholipase C